MAAWHKRPQVLPILKGQLSAHVRLEYNQYGRLREKESGGVRSVKKLQCHERLQVRDGQYQMLLIRLLLASAKDPRSSL